ncbi:hypothetical protein C8Q74DRAFT_1231233 [Fomes fomentarius]|nr:hypothetical protein C8Q74DRAFT_1231233 [Fomes fomentarius]
MLGHIFLLSCLQSAHGRSSLLLRCRKLGRYESGQYVMMDHIHLRRTRTPFEGSPLTGTYIWWRPALLGGVGVFYQSCG